MKNGIISTLAAIGITASLSAQAATIQIVHVAPSAQPLPSIPKHAIATMDLVQIQTGVTNTKDVAELSLDDLAQLSTSAGGNGSTVSEVAVPVTVTVNLPVPNKAVPSSVAIAALQGTNGSAAPSAETVNVTISAASSVKNIVGDNTQISMVMSGQSSGGIGNNLTGNSPVLPTGKFIVNEF
jgi:hypothetical protein